MSVVLTRRPPAPEFPAGFAWWNTDHPLALHDDLKGCVVVLDFWTYGCLNCLHLLAGLRKVEERFRGQPVVVIGVHSHKFPNETTPANIRAAILRERIHHPVIVDEDHQLWHHYGVAAWPTLVFIDSTGHVAGSVSGEVAAEEIERVVQGLLEEGRRHATLAPGPPLPRPEAMVPSASGLAFPGKIVADPASGRLFIADSGHHRILVTGPTGHLLQTIGAAAAGLADGSLATASFSDPRGLAFDAGRQLLYVADTGNHLIRRIDLAAGRVKTILGTGRQVYDRAGGGRGLAQGLNNPRDLALAGPYLYLAMAGAHQIWRLDLATLQAEPWVGSGREALADGPGFNAALAQPSGLVRLGDWLYVADSEVSALRRVRLGDGDAETLVGHGLFDFGDADGPFGRARLQHPLGVATDGRDVFIADTYNHKVKRASLAERTVTTLAGTGRPGTGEPDGPLALYEPGGLAWLDDRLYIADTNNHRIVVLEAGGAWHELVIRGERPSAAEEEYANGFPACTELAADAETIELLLEPALVEGFHVNPLAPCTVVVWEPEGQGGLLAGGERRFQCTLAPGHYPVTLELAVAREKPETGRLLVDLSFASCLERDPTHCKPERRRWDLAWGRAPRPPHPIRLVGGAIGTQP